MISERLAAQAKCHTQLPEPNNLREVDRMNDLKKTPFYDTHLRYGGKIIDFAGWALPVHFKKSIIEEHHATRNSATLFDVSDMGELEIRGENSLAMLQKLLVNDIAKGNPGRVIYSPMCNERGGCVDDLMVCCYSTEHYMLVINAGNIEKDYEWVKQVAKQFPGVSVKNISSETAQVAIQGPDSERIIQSLTKTPLSEIKYYRFVDKVDIAGINTMVARTGYTGEDGFEIYCTPEDGPALWDAIIGAGAIPAGLGCRDTLRFEASMPLYGQELDDVRGPIEAGLQRFVAFKKPDFIGRDALLKQHREGPSVKLVGFEMVGRGIARTGYPILNGAEKVGYVTTGSYAPTLGKNLGMGYVPPSLAEIGTEFDVEIRGKGVRARVIPMPFYKRGAK